MSVSCNVSETDKPIMPEFSRHDWSDMYMNPKHPKFVGCKPNRHPDEKCHAALAEAFVKEIKEKKLW